MTFILRSVFWLSLALFVIQAPGVDLADSARQAGAVAIETGRAAALDGLGNVRCDSFECTGAKFVAQSGLASPAPTGERVTSAPFPAPALNRVY